MYMNRIYGRTRIINSINDTLATAAAAEAAAAEAGVYLQLPGWNRLYGAYAQQPTSRARNTSHACVCLW